MIVLLFEDDRVGGLAPLSYTRPVFELRTGALNLRERVEMLAPSAQIRALVRAPLRALVGATLGELAAPFAADEPVVVLNGRLRASFDELATLLSRTTEGVMVDAQGSVLAAWLAPAAASDADGCLRAVRSLPRADVPAGVTAFRHVWELVHANRATLLDDFAALRRWGSPRRRLFAVTFHSHSERPRVLQAHRFDNVTQAVIYPGVHRVAPDAIALGPGARILPGVVLDAEGGPIVVGAGCRIAANATLEGPLYLGPGTVVNPGAKLREGTSAGAFCKLGGEIEDSILLDLSNKQHEGFLGHAYVGSWVNLGADTNGSDLKNNYGSVRVDFGEGPVDTGHTFVGPMFGDHAKTGINTMLSTGAVVGVAANVFGAGFPPRFVPSFVWGGQKPWVEYELDKASHTAQVVMGRREVAWTPEHSRLLAQVFDHTRVHRG